MKEVTIFKFLNQLVEDKRQISAVSNPISNSFNLTSKCYRVFFLRDDKHKKPLRQVYLLVDDPNLIH